jgi:branched-chain amino acid transport system substrate-binding protein
MTRYNRRALLKAGAAFAGASAIGFPALVSGQTDAIKIGHLTPLTGFLGAYAQLGIRMAEEEINAGGGVMGRKLAITSEDSVNPATAATKAQRMLDQDGVAFLMGEINSASALTIMQVAERNKRLFMQIGAPLRRAARQELQQIHLPCRHSQHRDGERGRQGAGARQHDEGQEILHADRGLYFRP